MTTFIVNVINSYNDILENKSDQRVKDWLMMSSPIPTIGITLIYLMVVTKIGPKLMENRKPFQLTNTLIFYNGFQMLLSGYIFYHACYSAGWLTDLKWFCQLPDYSMNPNAYATVCACWWLYIDKLSELLDTIFFMLRKKNNQISSLHLIHHGCMPVCCWIATKFLAGGSMSLGVLINSFIHIIMYGYYSLAALGPRIQKYLWWKKYLTIIQIVQFVVVIVHAVAHIFISDCAIPKVYVYILLSFVFVILVMFIYFYRIEYNKRTEQIQTNEDQKTK